MENKDIENITDVTELGLEPLNTYLNRICLPYRDIDLLNLKTYSVDDSVNLNGPRTRLVDIKDYTGKVIINKQDKEISVIPMLGGIGEETFINEIYYNNRTNIEPSTTYEIVINRANAKKNILAKFDSNKMYDIKEFKKETGCFCSFSEKEALEFLKQKSEEADKKIIEYVNTGKINFDKMDWLWSNAVYKDGQLYIDIDDFGRIKMDEHNYIRAMKKDRKPLPKYYINNKNISKVITDLFDNILQSWNGAIEPFLAIGFMSISPFYNYFWRHEGFGAIGFIGTTEGGKTEICNLASGIFGCDKTFFSTARATNVGIEQMLNSYNCIPRIIDDISRYNLTGDRFIDMLKQISNGGQRDKGLDGQRSGALPPCSPLVFTSNNIPAEKPEILNRMLYLSSDNLKFNPDVFNYFGCADKELSCILPYILKYTGEDIRIRHQHYKRWIKDTYGDSSDRMISQLAIAITGLNIFEEIAGNKLNIPWNMLQAYIQDCSTRFRQFKNLTEKLLEAFPTMIWNGNITRENHYKVSQDDNKIILTFSKVAVCNAYNKHFIEDKSQAICSRNLKPEKSDLYEILAFNKSVNINQGHYHGIKLDITKHPYAEAIYRGRYNKT